MTILTLTTTAIALADTWTSDNGNEDFLDRSGSYDERFAKFFDAIKKNYPQLKCISTVGNEQPADKRVHSRKPDALDEHYYRPADAFLKDAPTHFEHYDRKRPEIFVGEWAAYETPYVPWDKRSAAEPPTPDMKAALGDAAWMAGMERNSDIVTMQCYAPLFVNVNGRQWRPNLIGYDALDAFGSPSYYAIRMFSTNVGDTVPSVTLTGAPVQYSVTRDAKSGAIYAKLVNPQSDPQPLTIILKGVGLVSPTATAETLAADPAATNALDDPVKVVPVVSQVSGVKSGFAYTLPANSITVLKLGSR